MLLHCNGFLFHPWLFFSLAVLKPHKMFLIILKFGQQSKNYTRLTEELEKKKKLHIVRPLHQNHAHDGRSDFDDRQVSILVISGGRGGKAREILYFFLADTSKFKHIGPIDRNRSKEHSMTKTKNDG